ncbi:cysteine--tRNA ligase [Myxococcota bacterium]|nr:cysteine--tRNA ligase [Myxococcota bacterium]
MSVPTLRVYNTLSRSLEVFQPQEPGKVRLYVCGMTTYDYCHIGHARAMLSFDLVVRYLRWRGFEVTYVRNYTDVDDKIIDRAAELGEDPLALSDRFCRALDEDLAAMGLVVPDVQPKVSQHIPHIIAVTKALVDRGHAYTAGGDVYFSVQSFDAYGKLSGKKVDELIAGERVEVRDTKRHPADFTLWKAAKPGEIAWESPWGPGRPGWHIECSAMSMEYLGERFDIHGGGIDLVFPHHENEIAQSECATGHGPYARYWMHNGHLTIVATSPDQDDGSGFVKMSKSLGNSLTIRAVMEQVPAESLRLLYMESHYRSPLPFSADRLAEATGSLDRLYVAKEQAEELCARPVSDKPEVVAKELGEDGQALYTLAKGFRARFQEAMDQDFNAAQVVGDLFELARAINRLANDKRAKKRAEPLMRMALDAFQISAQVLGIGGASPADFFEEVKHKRLKALGLAVETVEAKLSERAQARADKDWARADAVRAELEALGVLVMDTTTGARWRMRVG